MKNKVDKNENNKKKGGNVMNKLKDVLKGVQAKFSWFTFTLISITLISISITIGCLVQINNVKNNVVVVSEKNSYRVSNSSEIRIVCEAENACIINK